MVQVVSARKQRFLNPWNADVTLPSEKKKKSQLKAVSNYTAIPMNILMQIEKVHVFWYKSITKQK